MQYHVISEKKNESYSASCFAKKLFTCWCILMSGFWQIYPALNANEIQILYDKYHKVSSLVPGIGKKSPKHTPFCNMKSNMKMSNSPAKYEVLIKQYLRSILDISGFWQERFRNTFNWFGHWNTILRLCIIVFRLFSLCRQCLHKLNSLNIMIQRTAHENNAGLRTQHFRLRSFALLCLDCSVFWGP